MVTLNRVGIKNCRTGNGLSMTEVANVLKITKEQYSKKEKGVAPFKDRELCELANFYNEPIVIFFNDDVRNKETCS